MSEVKLSLADTIKPKSDQLNYDDFIGGTTRTLTIRTLKAGGAEQPVEIFFEEQDLPFKPCKSMRRLLIAAWGDKGKDWIGKRMTLFGDPSVKFGGVEVGGIRISHLSGIDGSLTVKMTTTRSKRSDYKVLALADDESAA
jgi:hypothetical protein